MDGRHAHGTAGRVWDPLVRAFHWTLVAAFAAAWLFRSDAAIHETAGRVVLALVILRAAWGVAGPASARFSSFVRGPATTLRYLATIATGAPARHVGHNPAGAAMIVALLCCLAVTAGSGFLMATAALWGNAFVEEIHAVAAWASLALVAFHLGGVAMAVVQHRENLPWSMVTGRKLVDAGTASFLGPAPRRPGPWIGAAAILALGGALWAGAQGGLNASFWRMDRILAARLADAGCVGSRLAGPRIEIWPVWRLVYAVDGAEIAVPLATALERRPALDGMVRTPDCRSLKTASVASTADAAAQALRFPPFRPPPTATAPVPTAAPRQPVIRAGGDAAAASAPSARPAPSAPPVRAEARTPRGGASVRNIDRPRPAVRRPAARSVGNVLERIGRKTGNLARAALDRIAID